MKTLNSILKTGALLLFSQVCLSQSSGPEPDYTGIWYSESNSELPTYYSVHHIDDDNIFVFVLLSDSSWIAFDSRLQNYIPIKGKPAPPLFDFISTIEDENGMRYRIRIEFTSKTGATITPDSENLPSQTVQISKIT